MSKFVKFRLITLSLIVLHFLVFLFVFGKDIVMSSIFYITVFEFVGASVVFDLIDVFVVKKDRKKGYLLIPVFYTLLSILIHFNDFGNFSDRYCTTGYFPRVCYSMHDYAIYSVLFYFVFGFIVYHFHYFYLKKFPFSKNKKKRKKEVIIFVSWILIVILLGLIIKSFFNYII